MIRLQQVKLPVTHTKEELERAIEKILHVSSEQIKAYEIIKQSLDARKKAELKYSYVIDTEILKEQKVVKQCRNKNVSLIEKKKYVFPKSGSQPLRQRPVVVGAGPAGLFCALMLARHGYRPILLERGCDVETRMKDVEQFWKIKKKFQCAIWRRRRWHIFRWKVKYTCKR